MLWGEGLMGHITPLGEEGCEIGDEFGEADLGPFISDFVTGGFKFFWTLTKPVLKPVLQQLVVGFWKFVYPGMEEVLGPIIKKLLIWTGVYSKRFWRWYYPRFLLFKGESVTELKILIVDWDFNFTEPFIGEGVDEWYVETRKVGFYIFEEDLEAWYGSEYGPVYNSIVTLDASEITYEVTTTPVGLGGLYIFGLYVFNRINQ